jgi:hypothetical protein
MNCDDDDDNHDDYNNNNKTEKLPQSWTYSLANLLLKVKITLRD